MPSIDTRLVARNFGRAAPAYDTHARLQGEVREELLQRLALLAPETPRCIVDVGAGTGQAARQLRRQYRQAQVVALDLAAPMLQQARRQRGWWRPFQLLQADARALPFADASVDVLYSSLCLQWCGELESLFREWARVLRPGGLLLFATFGADTLVELRRAFAAVDSQPHLLDFPQLQQVGDAMHRAGLVDPVVDRDLHQRPVAELPQLLQELRGIGAVNAARERGRGLMGRGRWQRLQAAYEAERGAAGLPVSWEVIYGQAHGGTRAPRPERAPAGFDLEALRATLPSRRGA